MSLADTAPSPPALAFLSATREPTESVDLAAASVQWEPRQEAQAVSGELEPTFKVPAVSSIAPVPSVDLSMRSLPQSSLQAEAESPTVQAPVALPSKAPSLSAPSALSQSVADLFAAPPSPAAPVLTTLDAGSAAPLVALTSERLVAVPTPTVGPQSPEPEASVEDEWDAYLCSLRQLPSIKLQSDEGFSQAWDNLFDYYASELSVEATVESLGKMEPCAARAILGDMAALLDAAITKEQSWWNWFGDPSDLALMQQLRKAL